MHAAPAPSPPGITVIGYVSGNLGLGVAARSTVARLLGWGHPVSVVDVDPGLGRARRDLTYVSLERAAPHPQAVNLFHLNPVEIVRSSQHWARRVSLRPNNVCVPFWELPHLPRNWLPILRAMDAVLAPSRYIRTAIEQGLPTVPVLSYPQAVFVPAGVRADRERWGIADGAVTFLLAFDPLSDMARKNPVGAVTAFQRAFRSGERVALVVKLNRSGHTGWDRLDDGFPSLRAAMECDRRIRVIDEDLPYTDALSLYASVDAMVSLHRSEGCGLQPMEAMTLGKPVIATGWSGNMDFMSRENACLVGYTLERVRAVHPAYQAERSRTEQVWAEPDMDEAVRWMRRLAAEPELRASFGARAAHAMRAWAAAANAVSPFSAIAEAAAAGGPVAQARRRADLARMVRGDRLRRWRRKAASALGIGRSEAGGAR
ncbi:MAG: glycosyltransferase [Deltaproteobacteria bacterium]|nr:glycosyltransferase [Deltaproteobacteria bacterium]